MEEDSPFVDETEVQPDPATNSSKAPAPFYVQAAHAAWFAPLLGIFVPAILRRSTPIVGAIAAATLIAIGIVSAMIGLIGSIKNSGPVSSMLGSVIGFVLNALLIAMAIETWNKLANAA